MPLVSRHVFMNSIYEHFIFQSGFVDIFLCGNGLDVVLELCVRRLSYSKVIFMDSAKGGRASQHFCPHFLRYSTRYK